VEEVRVQGHLAEIEKMNRKGREKFDKTLAAMQVQQLDGGEGEDDDGGIITEDEIEEAALPHIPIPPPPPPNKKELIRRDVVYREEGVRDVGDKCKALKRCFIIDHGLALGSAETELVHALILKQVNTFI
jgi:hypothetical protein